MDELLTLLNAYIEADPRLAIWSRYPDVSEDEDDYTDGWACEQVSAEFAAFARTRGWDAVVVHGTDPGHPMAFDHAWVRLTRGGKATDIDWTARQFHNLFEPAGRDRNVLSLPWPLAWSPTAIAPEHHLIVGAYAALTLENP